MIHLVGHSKNGLPVYVDLVESAAAVHISRYPHLLTLATEILRNTALHKPIVSFEYDMGRVIGYDFVVQTTTADTIFYVRLVREAFYTRFTRNGKPLTTSYISMTLHRDPKAASYSMHDIWVGHLTPPLPGSGEETAESTAFWQEHAIVFENQPIQSRTLTKTNPY